MCRTRFQSIGNDVTVVKSRCEKDEDEVAVEEVIREVEEFGFAVTKLNEFCELMVE